jgi:hypothetical protein
VSSDPVVLAWHDPGMGTRYRSPSTAPTRPGLAGFYFAVIRTRKATSSASAGRKARQVGSARAEAERVPGRVGVDAERLRLVVEQPGAEGERALVTRFHVGDPEVEVELLGLLR